MIPLEVTRRAWKRAAEFPTDKERVYPEHGLAQAFDSHRGKMVLEYGCGGGSDTLSYLRRNNSVTYVDVTPDNVETTRARVEAEGYGPMSHGLVLEESDRIPLPSGLFDVASSHGVIHHIQRPLPVLQEIRRLLKPGGLLYCMLYTEHLYARFSDRVRLLVETKGLTHEEAFCWCADGEGTPWAVAYTQSEGEGLLKAAGLIVEDAREFNVCEVNGKPDFRTFVARAT